VKVLPDSRINQRYRKARNRNETWP